MLFMHSAPWKSPHALLLQIDVQTRQCATDCDAHGTRNYIVHTIAVMASITCRTALHAFSTVSPLPLHCLYIAFP